MFLYNYNVAINSYSIILLERSHSIEFSDHPTFAAHASIVIGLVAGVILFGFSYCIFSRRKTSFRVCSCLLLLGGVLSITPGFMSSLGFSRKLLEFAIARFIVGIGCGGLYSNISLLLMNSYSKSIDSYEIAFMYGPCGSTGLLVAPLIVALLDHWRIAADDTTCKMTLIGGSLPGIVLLCYSDNPYDDHVGSTDVHSSESLMSHSPVFKKITSTVLQQLHETLHSTTLKSYIIGASTSYFCFEAIFFGNFLAMVRVVDHLFLQTAYNPSSFVRAAIVGTICSLFFWLGGCFSILGLRRIGAIALQLHGFILTSVAFALLGVLKLFSDDKYWPFLMTTYFFVCLLVGFGPAPMTYLMPGLLFSHKQRTTLNGLVVSLGKFGAIVGILLSNLFCAEISMLMFIFSAFSLLGAGSTLIILNATFADKRYLNSYDTVKFSEFDEMNSYVTLAHADSHSDNIMDMDDVSA